MMDHPTNDYSAFDPLAYLREYYTEVSPENVALLRFLVRALASVPPDSLILDFGGGPTLYAELAAAPYAREIHFAEYQPANLEMVRRWLRREANSFDWGAFTRAILEMEGQEPTPHAIEHREALVRTRLTRLMPCNAYAPRPIGENRLYDVVITNFCAEAAARDDASWRLCMAHILSLLRPEGRLIVSAVMGADSYPVGEREFLAVRLSPEDLRTMLIEEGFDPSHIEIDTVGADGPQRHYEGLMFATALKGRAV